MPKHEKKVILFLVEGESDAVSFEGLLKEFFNSFDVRIHILRCDITTRDNPLPSEILSKFKAPIDNFFSTSKLLKSDILRIVHFIDTDGAFVSEDCVLSANQKKVSYTEDKILAPNPDGIICRNAIKSAVLRKLCSTNTIYKDIPYQIYFFSRNLEHVLHNCIENLTDSQKARLSDEFDARFENKLNDFIKFITDETFAVSGDYKNTWRFIQQNTNSLKRYSNIHLLFQ